MRKLLMIVLLSLMIGSCSVQKFNPKIPSKYEFERETRYSITEDLNKISKPTPIKMNYVKLNSNNVLVYTTIDSTEFFILSPMEMSKVVALKELAVSYKKVIIDQEDLINIKINKNNETKKLLELERNSYIISMDGWVNSENIYREEKRNHQIDNGLNKTTNYIVLILSLYALYQGGR